MDSDIGPSELSDIAEEPEEGLTDDTDDDQVRISATLFICNSGIRAVQAG